MYKTVSINNDTYQQLSAVAARLKKSKAQVIDEAIGELIESINEKDRGQLHEFNARMKERINRIKLPTGTSINTDDIDSWISGIEEKDI